MAYAKIRPRRGTASEWIKANPVLLEGEIGIEVPSTGIGTGLVRMKFGDSVTPWNSLPYGATESDLVTAYGNSIHVDKAKNAPAFVDIYGVSTQDGTPAPDSPVTIESTVVSEIRVYKKNTFKCSGLTEQTKNGGTFTPVYDDKGFLQYVNVNGTFTADTLYDLNLLPEISEPVYLNGCPSGGSASTYAIQYSNLKDFAYQDFGGGIYIDGQFDYSKYPSSKIVIKISGGYTANNLKFYPMIRLATDIDDTYEPYSETVYTLPSPITLNGLNGVSDYIDLKRGKLVQRTKTITFNGSESWSSGSSKAPTFHAPTNLLSDRMKTADGTQFMCDKLSYVDKIQSTELGYGCAFNPNVPYYNYFYVQVPSSVAVIGDTSTFKTWLASNPITVLYALETPIETPLSDEVIQVLNDIVLHEGVNNITTDSTGEIKLLYATNENSVITMTNYKNIVKILEMLGGFSFVLMSKSEHEAITDPEPNTVYLVYKE